MDDCGANRMKLLSWRIRYSYHFWRRTGISLFFGWQSSGASCDSFDDEETPLDAVDSELSYWTD